MQATNDFLKQNKRKINEFLFSQLCDDCDFICVERNNIEVQDEELRKLFDKTYVFKNSGGKEFFVANTELTMNEVYKLLQKYELRQYVAILGPGFEGENPILVAFNKKNIKKFIK